MIERKENESWEEFNAREKKEIERLKNMAKADRFTEFQKYVNRKEKEYNRLMKRLDFDKLEEFERRLTDNAKKMIDDLVEDIFEDEEQAAITTFYMMNGPEFTAPFELAAKKVCPRVGKYYANHKTHIPKELMDEFVYNLSDKKRVKRNKHLQNMHREESKSDESRIQKKVETSDGTTITITVE